MRTLVERAVALAGHQPAAAARQPRAPSTSSASRVQKVMAELPDADDRARARRRSSERRDALVEQGVPEDLATRVAVLHAGVHAARHRRDRRRATTSTRSRSPACTSRSASGSACRCWCSGSSRCRARTAGRRWPAAALRDDLHAVHAQLTAQVLLATSPDDSAPARIAAWEDDDEVVVSRAVATLEEICADDSADLARMSVGLRVVRGLLVHRMTDVDAGRPPPDVGETARTVDDRRGEAHAPGPRSWRPRWTRIAAADPGLNAFSVRAGRPGARPRPTARDELLASGATPGPLHGVPVAIKEEIDVAGTVTTFGGEANSHAGRRRRRDGHAGCAPRARS